MVDPSQQIPAIIELFLLQRLTGILIYSDGKSLGTITVVFIASANSLQPDSSMFITKGAGIRSFNINSRSS